MEIPKIWTIGHSTRPIDEFVSLLKIHNIQILADVRHYPGSKYCPQYNAECLANLLPNREIVYAPFQDLGGRRSTNRWSKNTNWKNASFRGYADYMETNEFQTAVRRLISVVNAAPTAIMCAEALWWKCHRSMLSDWFKANGTQVLHIINKNAAIEHTYTRAANVRVNGFDYHGPQIEQNLI